MGEQITAQSTNVDFPENGSNRSEVLRKFSANAVSDIHKLAKGHNIQNEEIKSTNAILNGEMAYLRTGLKSLEASQESQQANSSTVIESVDFYSKKNVMYAESAPDQNKLVVNQKYGQTYLPSVTSVPIFYREESSTGKLQSKNLKIEVTPTELASGGVMAEVSKGDPSKAFNGHNNEYWIREVRYPLESPVSEVTVQLEVSLPTESSGGVEKFNVVQVHPFPVDRCDIVSVEYKTSANSSFILLEEFPQSVKQGEAYPSPDPINNCDFQQFIGGTRDISAMRITLRQRNWVEKEHQKVFTYGLQELNVKFENFSTQNTTYSNDLELNNHLIYKIESPKNTLFKNITGIYAEPLLNLETETRENNHIVAYLSKTPSITASSDILWNSFSSTLPQNSTSAVDLTIPVNAPEYYLIVIMKYVSDLKSATSPFTHGCTPVLKGVRTVHSVESLDTTDVGEIDSTDWAGRNWALHTGFVSHMDVYRSAVEDGSNCFVFGDDFWNDPDWRTALSPTPLDKLQVSEKLMSLTTENNAAPSASGGFGTIVYAPVESSLWQDQWTAKKFRIQSVCQIPTGGARVTFTFDYTTDQGPQTAIEVEAGNAPAWEDLADNGVLQSFQLSIKLTNSSVGGQQPVLGQFILIMKD